MHEAQVLLGAPLSRTSNGDLSGYVMMVDTSTQTLPNSILKARDGELGDQFGVSVAMHGDSFVIGAQSHANGGLAGSLDGAAYVFQPGPLPPPPYPPPEPPSVPPPQHSPGAPAPE